LNEPDTRYARLDGHRIAYQISGEGPIDIVFCTGMASIDAESRAGPSLVPPH
jgi:hypothetical protein